MPVTPAPEGPVGVPDYWSIATFSFNRSQAYPDHPEYWNVFPNDIRIYDINGDGHLDVLITYAYIPAQDNPGIPIRVLLGDGQGNLIDGTAGLFPAGAPLADAASASTVADFNGDGVDDIYIAVTWETASAQPRSSLLLLSDGQGGVIDASATLPQVAQYPHWTTSADIDGDGDIDIYVCNLGNDFGDYNGTSSYFLINDGTGQFTRSDTRLPATIETGGRNFTSSLLFDADNDGDPDLLLGTWPSWYVNGTEMAPSTLLFNDGSGNFIESAASNLPDPIFAPERAVTLDMAATDMNGDGFLDVFVLTADLYEGYAVQVLVNNGDGTFRDETAERLPSTQGLSNHRFMHLSDVNADGSLDLILQTGDITRFFLNDGSGHYVALPADFLFTNGGDYAFLPGDFDEDGRTDMFVRTIINSWEDPNNSTEFDWIARWTQPADTLLIGDATANAILGANLAETLQGLGGDDVIFGGGGKDRLEGGAGADYLNGGDGDDLIYGGDGNDTLMGWLGADHLYGGLGNDIYVVTDTTDFVHELVDEGIDTVKASISYTLIANLENLDLAGSLSINGTGNGFANVINGNIGNNLLSGLGGDDILRGNAGNDTLVGGAGLDKMYGGTGDDTYVVSDTTDYVFENAGEGTDTVLSSISLTLRPNVENLTLTGVANVFGRGNELDNAITGNNGANKLFGMDGNDVLTGGGGNDRLDGGAGADQLVGGTGNDLYYINDAFDTVTELVGQGTDRVYAGISYVLDANIEYLTLTGSANLDATGNNLANFIYGNSGQNILFGLNGDDRIWGWAGNDVLDGGSGTDRLWGGQGDDIYYVHSSTDYTYEYAGEGTDTVYSDVSLILRANVENLILTGSANNYGRGNGEANAITGNSGANKLFGLTGDDLLDGGAGDDLIEGGAGRDVMSGGSGADLFVFNNGDFAGMGEGSADRILDFSQAEGDRLRVSAVDANTNLGGDQAFAFIGTDAFHGVAGELRYEAINGNTYVMGDTDGDGNADFWIRLDGLHTLNSGDFIL